jgi:predicted metal-dependent phosphoesterase TrpH
MKRADLHSHTTISDGSHTPTEVVTIAAKLGLAAIAITDHDSIAGIYEAQQAGKRLGVEVIPAVEISTIIDERPIDILGYFVDPDYPVLKHFLQRQQAARVLRNERILQRLAEIGIIISNKELEANRGDDSEDANAGRVHIGQILIQRGFVKDLNEAFAKYLGKDGLAFVPLNNTHPQEAIAVVNESGGVAVVAHPGLYGRDDLLPQIAALGLTGLEVNHPDHTENDITKYQEIAKQLHLIPTAGSDYHGLRNGKMHHANLGTCTVSMDIVEQLRAASKK